MATNLSGDGQLIRSFLIGLGSAIIVFFPLPIEAQSSCPKTITSLTESLLNDLPGYANRVIQRSRFPSRNQANSTYIISAGKPEFNPLTANLSGDYTPAFPQTNNEQVAQVFFTTLERQYGDKNVYSIQNYHWLFLTTTEQGWYLVTLYSRFGLPDKTHPPTPPQETSEGIIGKAIQLWLRDCRFHH
ncbi:hypothetical protein PCC7418_3202 [Halothece sp. PCC 7418]|uniref:hypothetical protein n=1 Tax=Halothece sp. (strain PCC 7418) TaxID=65093 RepID=UPI0002A06E94|nr:hypothetical protein [Halothece sp. PCC 7418]AFZ45318.1 hypothetical protein PCC7418_3202 [Halothece sp. PCC 7418]